MQNKEIEKFIDNYIRSKSNFYTHHLGFENNNINMNEIENKDRERKIETIQKDMYGYAINVVSKLELYHYNILYTNVKRWKSLLKGYSKDRVLSINDDLFLYMELTKTCIKKSCIKENKNDNLYNKILIFLRELHDIINNREYKKIIEYSLELNEPSLLEKLVHYVEVDILVNEIYNVKIPQNMNGKKIYNILKNKEKNSYIIE